jgi:hypothetical protein
MIARIHKHLSYQAPPPTFNFPWLGALLPFLQHPRKSSNPYSDVMMKLVSAVEASRGEINGLVYNLCDVEE